MNIYFVFRKELTCDCPTVSLYYGENIRLSKVSLRREQGRLVWTLQLLDPCGSKVLEAANLYSLEDVAGRLYKHLMEWFGNSVEKQMLFQALRLAFSVGMEYIF